MPPSKKSCQMRFHQPLALLAYWICKPSYRQWTILSELRVPVVLFWAGLKLNISWQGIRLLAIAKSDKHSTAGLPNQDSNVHILRRLYCEQYSILHCSYLNWEPPYHSALGAILLLHHCLFSFILNTLFKFLQCKLGTWVHTPALLKFFTVIGISQTSNHRNEYI